MSLPNPFSSSNVLEHIVAPKVVGSSGGYQVAVDLVDIDTVYSRQIGSTALPVSIEYLTQLGTTGQPVVQGYFTQLGAGPDGNTAYNVQDLYVNRIHWTEFIPTLPGGGGGGSLLGGTGIALNTTGGGTITVISSLIAGGTGIGVSTQPNGLSVEYVLSNLTSVTGGTGIQVTQTGNTFNLVSNLGFVAGTPNVTIGQVGNTYTFSVSSTPSPTGATFTSLTGPTGQIVYTIPSGTTSTANIVYDGTTLNIPSTRLSTPGQGGVLSTSTYQTNVRVESGFAQTANAGNLTRFTSVQGSTGVLTIDTTNERVGIRTNAPTTTLDVYGQTQITYDGIQNLVMGASGTAGSTFIGVTGNYVLSGWGAGGSSGGGTGGAGGYASAQVTISNTGTLSWVGQYGGPSGGGNALTVAFNGATFMYVPGGGAGASGGIGAAALEAQGFPVPMGGVSATSTGVTSFAFYNDPQNYLYTIVTPVSTTGATFNSGSIGGLTSVGASGTNITFSPAAVQTGGSPLVYTIGAGTSVTITPNNLVFAGSTLESNANNIVASFVPSIGLDAGTGTTGITGNDYALYDFWPGNTYPSIQGSPPISVPPGSSFNVGSGNVSWTSGTLAFIAGTTWSFSFTGSINDPPPGNVNLTFAGPVTMVTNNQLPSISNAVIFTDAGVTLPAGSTVGVSYRQFINYGATASGPNGIEAGGGGYTGGGAAAHVDSYPGILTVIPGTTGNRPAGGGAGSWGFIPVPDVTITPTPQQIGGSGIFPYISPFNPTGLYGAGGTTGTGGSQFLVVQQQPVNPVVVPALIVNGNELVNGNLTVTGTSIFAGSSAGVNTQVGSAGTPNNFFVYGGYYGAGPTGPANFPVGLTSTGGTFSAQVAAGNGVSITQGSTANLGQEMRLIWNQISGGSGMGEIIISNLNPVTSGGVAIYNQYTGVTGFTQLASFQQTSASILQSPSSAGATLTVNGNIVTTQNVYGNDLIATSDVRSKNSIVTVDSALDKVMKMRGVFFERNTEPGERRIGVIAQEVEEILPEVVHTDEAGMKSVSYGSIIGLLIEAIKELKQKTT